MKRIALAVALFCLLTGPAFAEPVIKEKSTIDFTTTQMGVPVRGGFRKFDADVRFDPKDLKKSRASITIYVDGIDTGYDEATAEMGKKTWFDAAGHPKAEFVSSSIVKAGLDRYKVSGKLTIKRRTRDVSAMSAVRKEKDLWLFEGSFVINRLDFEIGEGAWTDTGTVANEVEVSFRLYVKNTVP